MQAAKLGSWPPLKVICMHSTNFLPTAAKYEVYKQEICQFAKKGAMQLETYIDAVCTLNVWLNAIWVFISLLTSSVFSIIWSK